MECPYNDRLLCPYVDTAEMEKTTSCLECEYYPRIEVTADDKGWDEFIEKYDIGTYSQH